MISTHLPPGTDLIAIRSIIPCGVALEVGCRPLVAGFRFTLRRYAIDEDGTVLVLVNEIINPFNHEYGEEWAYGRDSFAVVQLPELPAEILSCLNVDPEQARVLVEEDA